MFKNDREMFDHIRKNGRVAILSDMCDALGHRNQAMHQRLRPLLPDPEKCGFAGRARTLRWMETDYVVEEDPYGLELDAMDSLKPGDVIVHSTDKNATNAPWGELMTTAAIKRGAVGCVCDSNIRDCVQILSMNFPVYCAGIRPIDSKGRGRVMAYDVPITCGEVLVQPGELIVADFDGIVVIPKTIEQQVIELSKEKSDKENLTRKGLQDGKALREMYNKYKVL